MEAFKHFKRDFFGGITAGIVALPLALAFGLQSGMGAITGIYGAMILGIFASLFGGTATQISGPTGPMTVVSAMVVTSAIEVTGSLEAGMGIIIGSFILAGILQIIFGVVRIGRYIRYIPYSVLSGFMTGIGVLIIILQIFPLLGHISPKDPIYVVYRIGQPLSNISFSSLGLGLLTIGIIYLFPKINKTVPSILVALIVSTLAAYFLKLDVSLIGDIPQGLPSLKIGEVFTIDPKMSWTILEYGSMLAALGSIDSLLTAVIADNITKTKHHSNRELIGQGIGNTLSALVGGLPGAGATMRTVVNIRAGGKTKLSGIIHGLLLLAMLWEFGWYASFIPKSVLAGILITVGIGIIDYRGLKHLLRVPRTDAVILFIVLLITVFGNLLHAVGVGMVLSCVLFMKQVSDLAEGESQMNTFDDSNNGLFRRNLFQGDTGAKVFVKELYGPLFFGVTSHFNELMMLLTKDTEILVICMDKVPYIDQTGLYALEDSISALHKKNVTVVLTGVQAQPMQMLTQIDLIPNLVRRSHVFVNYEACERWLRKQL